MQMLPGCCTVKHCQACWPQPCPIVILIPVILEGLFQPCICPAPHKTALGGMTLKIALNTAVKSSCEDNFIESVQQTLEIALVQSV